MTMINSLNDSVKTTIRKVLITATFVIIDFMLFLLMTTVKITTKIYTSQSHHVKRYIQATIKIKNIRPEKLTEIDLLIMKDSIMKEVKGWDISENNSKVVTKHFNGATTDDMSYTQPTISNDSEDIVLHCDTNNMKQNFSAVEIGQKILELAASCKSDSNNILISGIVQSRGKLNAKAAQVNSFLKNKCGKSKNLFYNQFKFKP